MKFSLLSPAILLLIAAATATGCKTKPAPRLTVTGNLNYANFIVTPGCTVEVRLDDVSRADAPATTLAREFITPRETAPLPFELHYDPSMIQPNHRYVVFAQISCSGQLRLITDSAVPVITQGNPTSVEVTLKPAAR